MTDKSAAELERDAEALRSKVVGTAETIRGKMTPGQLIDEFTGLFSGSDSSAMLRNLKVQVQDNPLPITVIGAGVAWLMLGSGTSIGSSASGVTGPEGSPPRPGSSRGGGGMFSDAADTVVSAAHGAAETASGLAEGVVDAISNSAPMAGSRSSDLAFNGARSAQELLRSQPLAAAALGLAVGAAIGVMLPHTEIEDERLGEYRDRLQNRAQEKIEAGLDEANQVLANTYETAKQEADRQMSGEGSFADRVSSTVRSTIDKTEQDVRSRLANPDEKT